MKRTIPKEFGVYERIHERQLRMDKKYGPLVGKRVKDFTGQEWQFKTTNDLGIPYFSKVKNGKAQEKEFVVAEFDKEWLDEHLEPSTAKTKTKSP